MGDRRGKKVAEGSGNSFKGWSLRKTRNRHPFWEQNHLWKGSVRRGDDGKPIFFPTNRTMSIKDQHRLMWLIRDEQQNVSDIEASVEDNNFWNKVRYKWAQKSGQWLANIELKEQYEEMYWLESKNFFFFWHPPELAEDPDVIANEISNCYKHRWTDEHDELLMSLHSQAMVTEKDIGGNFLNGNGWKIVHKMFVESTRHLVGLHNIQQRYHKVVRARAGVVEEPSTEPDYDCNLVVFREWKEAEDNFLRRWYDQLILTRLPNKS